MNRRAFLGLLGLTGCIEDMSLFQSLLIQPSALDRLYIGGRSNLITYGDSMTIGQNASIPGNAYGELLKSAYFSTRTNGALSGSGIWRAAASAIISSYTRTNTVVSFMAGLNDIRRNGSSTTTLNKIEACTRVIFCKCIHGSSYASGGTGVTRVSLGSPGYNAYNAISNGGVFPAGSLGTNVASFSYWDGDYYEWTFTGTQFGISFIAAYPTDAFASADIVVDGNVIDNVDLNGWYDGVSDGVYNNQRGPLSLTWHGFSNTSHTVRVVNTCGLTRPAGAPFAIDFFFEILPPASANVVIGLEIPYLDATGYVASPSNGSVAASILGSQRIFNVMDFYRALGYPNVYIPVNNFYNLGTGLDTDHIHPNDTGHAQIMNAISQYVYV